MGVRGLWSLVKNNEKFFCDSIPISDYTKVIIDSNSFLYHIYEKMIDTYKFNGEYDLLQGRLLAFFELLELHKLEPYFIFDGVHRENDPVFQQLYKLQWKIKDLADDKNTSMLPLLAQEQLINEVQKRFREKKHHARADFTADGEIVALANKWQCPVMSNDSDFFIFTVEHGVIPFENLKRVKDGKVVAYKQQVLFGMLNGLSSEKLTIYAALVSLWPLMQALHKRYPVKDEEMKRWSNSEIYTVMVNVSVLYWLKGKTVAIITEEIEKALKWDQNIIKKLKSDWQEKDMDIKDALTYFKETRDGYKATVTNTDKFLADQEPLMPRDLSVFSTEGNWFYKMFKAGRISTNSLNVLICEKVIFKFQIEKFENPSTWKASLPLRQAMYEIMHNGSGKEKRTIVEYDRDQKMLNKEERHIIKNEGLPSFQKLQGEGPEKRCGYLFDVLRATDKRDHKDPHAMALHTLSFCVRQAGAFVPPNLVKSLLVSFHAPYDAFKDDIGEVPKVGDKAIVHGIAQYQACLHSAVELNQLLLCPLQEPDLKIMSGRYQHQLCKKLEKMDAESQNEFLKKRLREGILHKVNEWHRLIESDRKK